MLRFLIKRNLSTLSTVMVLLWIFILPFLESKKRISKWQWCAWLLFSIILFFLNQMKVSIFYTVFYGIIVHFLITMIFTNSSLWNPAFYS